MSGQLTHQFNVLCTTPKSHKLIINYNRYFQVWPFMMGIYHLKLYLKQMKCHLRDNIYCTRHTFYGKSVILYTSQFDWKFERLVKWINIIWPLTKKKKSQESPEMQNFTVGRGCSQDLCLICILNERQTTFWPSENDNKKLFPETSLHW